MKISQPQQNEIEFLMSYFGRGVVPSQEQKEEYIRITVHGKKSQGKFTLDNPIFTAKMSLDRTIKMWREDLVNGLLGIEELESDFGSSEYGRKLIQSILVGLRSDPPPKDVAVLRVEGRPFSLRWTNCIRRIEVIKKLSK